MLETPNDTLRKSNKKYPESTDSGYFSGCGGRTRTYGLRVMSAPGVISPHILWVPFEKYHAVPICLLFTVMPSRSASCHIKGGQKEVNRQFEYDRVLRMLISYFESTQQSVPFAKESIWPIVETYGTVLPSIPQLFLFRRKIEPG